MQKSYQDLFPSVVVVSWTSFLRSISERDRLNPLLVDDDVEDDDEDDDDAMDGGIDRYTHAQRRICLSWATGHKGGRHGGKERASGHSPRQQQRARQYRDGRGEEAT